MQPSRRSLLGLATSAWALAGCSGPAVLNKLSGNPASSVDEGLAYGPEARQRADVYHPPGDAPAGGWPMVMFFYGGSWDMGSRAEYKFVGEALASRGLLTAIADYRLYPDVVYPDFLVDCARALAWWRTRAAAMGGNADRLYVMGHSAGAYNASMLALDPRWLGQFGDSPRKLAGWVGLAGPYDFYPIGDPDIKPIFHYPDYPPHSQPIPEATAAAPRTFLGAAKNDKLVDPQRSTVQMAQRLESLGVPVELKLYDGLSHALLIGAVARPLRFLAPVLDDVSSFMLASPTA